MSCPAKCLQFLRRERAFDFQKIRAARHPLQVLRQAKRPAVADAHGLKQPVAIHETAVVDGDDRLRPRAQIDRSEKQAHEIFNAKTQRRRGKRRELREFTLIKFCVS